MMLEQWKKFQDRRRFRKLVADWEKLARNAGRFSVADLRDLRLRARELGTPLQQIRHIAADVLSPPLVGTNAFLRVANSDWRYRPEFWTGPMDLPGWSGLADNTAVGSEMRVFHNCPHREITLAQRRNHGETVLAPYGLALECFRFGGNFLSLAIQLPKSVLDGLQDDHIIRMDLSLQAEYPMQMYSRLNLVHGPNTAEIERGFTADKGPAVVEFDLKYSDFAGIRATRMWVDLFFNEPASNLVRIRDLTFSRFLRANI